MRTRRLQQKFLQRPWPVLLMLALTPLAPAVELQWDRNTSTSGPQGGSGYWYASYTNSIYNNWWNGTTNILWPTNGSYDAYFGGDVPGGHTNGSAVKIGSAHAPSARKITVDASYYSFAGDGTNGCTLTLSAGSPTTSNMVINYDVSSFSPVIAGSSGLTKSGPATLWLNQPTSYPSTFTGGVYLLEGAIGLSQSDTNCFGSTSNSVNFNGGSLLVGTSANNTFDRKWVVLDNGGTAATTTNVIATLKGGLTGTGPLTLSNTSTTGTFAFRNNSAANFTYSGTLTLDNATLTSTPDTLTSTTPVSLLGTATVRLLAGSTLNLRSNDSTPYHNTLTATGTGSTTLSIALANPSLPPTPPNRNFTLDTLQITQNHTLSLRGQATTGCQLQPLLLEITGGTLDLDPNTSVRPVLGLAGPVHSLASSQRATIRNGALDLLATSPTFTIAQGSTPDNIDMQIDSPLTSSLANGSLIKDGPGHLVLAHSANTYTGTTTINAGTLTLPATAALTATSALTVAPAATLNLAGTIPASASLTAQGQVHFSHTNTSLTSLTGSGTLTLDNITLSVASGTFSGSLSGTGTLRKTGPGTLELTSAPALPIQVTAGTLALASNQLANITIDNGATLTLQDPAQTLHLQPPSIAPGGKLDIKHGQIRWTTTNLDNDWTQAQTLLVSNAITSSETLRHNGLPVRGVALTLESNPDSTHDIALTYALIGDTNFDNRITMDDYLTINNSYLFGMGTQKGFAAGDFNGDNQVNRDDYLLLDNTYLYQQNTLATDLLTLHASWFGPDYLTALGQSVPEPTSLSLLLAGVGLLCRRRR